MRFPAAFTVIALGVAGTATAAPKQEEISGRVSLNEKNAKDRDSPRPPSGWIELASPTPAKHGTEFVVIGREAGYFSQLRVKATKGRTVVRRVKVFFADGGTRTVKLDRAVANRGRDSVVVSLGEPRPIDRIVVTTDPGTRGMYAVYGSSSGGGATVVGSR